MLARKINDLDPYSEMIKKFTTIVESYGLNIGQCDIVEETILKMAEIDETPQGCRFSIYENIGLDYCIFAFTISAEAGRQLVTYLNRQFPFINAKNITAAAESLDISTDVNGHPAIIIQMNIDAIQRFLLPEFEKYLKTHPEVVKEYSHSKYKFEHVKTILQRSFHAEHVDEVNIDNFVQALWNMLVRNAPGGKIIADTLFMFSLDVIGIINNYLTFNIYEPNEIVAGLKILSGSINQNIRDPLYTDLNISFTGLPSTKPHRAFEKYLGVFASQPIHEIKLGDDEKKTSVQTRVITMHNTAWMNPEFHSAAQKAFIDYSQEQKQPSKPRMYSSAEAYADNLHKLYIRLTNLKKIKKFMIEKEEYKDSATKLIGMLQEYIDYIETTENKNVEQVKLENFNNQIREAIEITSKSLSQEFKKRERFSRGFFIRCKTFDEIVDEIKTDVLNMSALSIWHREHVLIAKM